MKRKNSSGKIKKRIIHDDRRKKQKSDYDGKPDFASKKYSRVIECFAKQQGLSLDEALGLFYHSEVHQLMRDGVSDMHCMSDLYLAEELRLEYQMK